MSWNALLSGLCRPLQSRSHRQSSCLSPRSRTATTGLADAYDQLTHVIARDCEMARATNVLCAARIRRFTRQRNHLWQEGRDLSRGSGSLLHALQFRAHKRHLTIDGAMLRRLPLRILLDCAPVVRAMREGGIKGILPDTLTVLWGITKK